jgi:hypothetical protein
MNAYRKAIEVDGNGGSNAMKEGYSATKRKVAQLHSKVEPSTEAGVVTTLMNNATPQFETQQAIFVSITLPNWFKWSKQSSCNRRLVGGISEEALRSSIQIICGPLSLQPRYIYVEYSEGKVLLRDFLT